MEFNERWTRGSRQIPPYVYKDLVEGAEPHLCQGDIIHITGELRLRFRRYYPAIRHPAFQEKYALVLTQTCDLVPRRHGKEEGQPSALHVSLCPIRPITEAIAFELRQVGKRDVNGYYLLPAEQHKILTDKVGRLVNNSESKHLFFLPKHTTKLPHHSVAILSLGYAFRSNLCPAIFKNRVLSLKPEFQAKIGMILSEYYGRVATSDLLEECQTQGLLDIARYILDEARVIEAHSDNAVKEIKKKDPKTKEEIESLRDTFVVEEKMKKINAIKKNVNKFYSQKLFELLKDPAKIAALGAMSDMDLRKEVHALSAGVEPHLVPAIEEDEA